MNLDRAFASAKALREDGCPDTCNRSLELLTPELQQEIKSMPVTFRVSRSIPGIGRIAVLDNSTEAAAGHLPSAPTTAAPAAQPKESTMNIKAPEKPKEKPAAKSPAKAPPTVDSPSTAPDKPAEGASKIKPTTAKSRREPGARPAAKAGAELPKKPDLKATTAGSGPKPKQESKTQLVDRLLHAKVGVTREKLSEATGWPSVNLRVAAGRRPDHVLVENEAGRFRLLPKADYDAFPKDEAALWTVVKF